MRGGNLIHELRATLYDLPKRPMVTSFMAGLGGDVVMLEDFHYMAKILQKMVKDNKTHRRSSTGSDSKKNNKGGIDYDPSV